MDADQIFFDVPIPIIGILVFALLCAARTIGATVRQRGEKRAGAAADDDAAQDGYIVSAALGLLALLLGFTFSLAIDRYDHRRALVLDEANAIGTTYLRAQLLDEPSRSRLSALLLGYAENRLTLAETTDSAARNRLMADTDRLQMDLWQETATAIRPIRDQEIAASFVETMNATIDAGAARIAARRGHVPARVLTLLVIYMSISAFILGNVVPRSRRPTATIVLLALLSLAYSLTLDIDRPVGGGVRVPQTPMEDLIAMMRESPPERFGPIQSDAAQ